MYCNSQPYHFSTPFHWMLKSLKFCKFIIWKKWRYCVVLKGISLSTSETYHLLQKLSINFFVYLHFFFYEPQLIPMFVFSYQSVEVLFLHQRYNPLLLIYISNISSIFLSLSLPLLNLIYGIFFAFVPLCNLYFDEVNFAIFFHYSSLGFFFCIFVEVFLNPNIFLLKKKLFLH